MEYLYVLLLYLPSGFGRLTQKATGYRYTHVAVSLDDTYTHFYAFSRLRARTPPISGYIEEKRIYYTLGEDVPIYTKIFRVPVSRAGYENAIRFMEDVKHDPEIMYNLIHMLLIPLFGGHPLYKAYNCGSLLPECWRRRGSRSTSRITGIHPNSFPNCWSRMFCLKELWITPAVRAWKTIFSGKLPKKSILQRLYILSGSCFSARSFTVHRNGFSLKKSAFPTAVNCEIIQKEETGFLIIAGTCQIMENRIYE